MARKKTAAAPRAARVDPDPLEVLPDDVAELDLESFLEEMGGGASSIDIWRLNRDGSRSHVDRVGMDVMNEGDIYALLRSYGGGRFQLIFKDTMRRYKASRTIGVEPGRADGSGGAPGAAASNPNTEAHLQFMREQMTLQQNLLTSLIASIRGPDIGSLLQGVGAMTKTGTDPAAMLNAVVAAFSTLRGPAQDEDWLTRAKTIIELAKDLQPGAASTEDNLYSVIRDVGKSVVGGLMQPGMMPAAMMQPPPPQHYLPPPIAPPAPAAMSPTIDPAASTPHPPPAAAAAESPRAIVDYIRDGLAYLKGKAAKDKDPLFFAEWITENLDEPQCAALYSAVYQGATFEQLLGFDAELSENPVYSVWFRTLYDELQSQLRKPLDPAGPGGDARNAPDDAAPGAARSHGAGSPTPGNGVSASFPR